MKPYRRVAGGSGGLSLLSALLVSLAFSTPIAAQSTTSSFSFPDRGGFSVTTSGTSPTLSTGFATITSNGAVPAGFAVFGLNQNNILISETTVPEATLVSEGRIYVDVGNGTNTGLAIANPNSQAVSVAYYFTDQSGAHRLSNVLTIPAGEQIAKFLTEEPFNVPADFVGTLTFFTLGSQPGATVGVIALRGFTNERGEFLMTTLPVTPVGSRGLFSGSVLPHFASGAGWTTQVILVNPTDEEEDGTISFTDQSGQPAAVTSSGATAAVFPYSVAPSSAASLSVGGAAATIVGSVQIASTGVSADIPVGFLAFTFQSEGITVSSAGLPPSRPATAVRVFAETSGPFNPQTAGSFQTAIAISNAGSSVPVHVTYDLTDLNGVSTGLQGALDIPAGGQTAQFLTQLPGLQNLPSVFQGVLRFEAPTPVTVLGLRGRYNQRGDFLLTTVPVVNESDPYFSLDLEYSSFVFPHFADGGGYTTQFVLFSGWTTGPTNGTLQFFNSAGLPLPLTLPNR